MLRTQRLANGLRLILDSKTIYKTSTIVVAIGRGSADEPRHLSGIFHLLEHLALQKDWWPNLRAMDAIGAETNAITGKDIVMFYLTVPNRYLIWALELMTAVIKNPGFSEKGIATEKSVIYEELAEYDDDGYHHLDAVKDQLIYSNSPLRFDEGGTRRTLEPIDLRNIRMFWRRLTDPRHMVITVVGDFDRREVRAILADNFGTMPQRLNPIELRPMIRVRPSKKRLHHIQGFSDLKQINFNWCIPLPGYGSHYRLPLTVLHNIIGGRYSSRLNMTLRDQGLIYSLFSRLWFYPEAGDMTILSASTPEHIYEVLMMFRQTLSAYQSQGVDVQEFELAIQNLRANTLTKFARSESAALFYAAQSAVHNELVEARVFLHKLAEVKRKQVNEAAAKYLRQNKMSLVYLGPLTRAKRRRVQEIFLS